MLARLPKEDVIRGGRSVRNGGFTITDVYPTKANVGNRRRCEGSGSVILGLWGAGAAGEAG